VNLSGTRGLEKSELQRVSFLQACSLRLKNFVKLYAMVLLSGHLCWLQMMTLSTHGTQPVILTARTAFSEVILLRCIHKIRPRVTAILSGASLDPTLPAALPTPAH
jgi:hypothetical protein